MKTTPSFIVIIFLILTLQACNDKKLTEVVEVPLPAKEEKLTIGNPEDVKAEDGPFEMARLPYQYDALSPAIDVLTMEMHYSKHYLTYTNNLNSAIIGTENEKLPIEDILKKAGTADMILRNNAGGYYNHTLFWDCISPKAGGQPKDTLAVAINADFGSFDTMKTQFIDAAEKQFGSGWAWLLVDKSGKLQVASTPNQDNPLMPGVAIQGKPILCLDLWEHAYYLNYQYKRKSYINAFFTIINWKKAGERYEEAIKK